MQGDGCTPLGGVVQGPWLLAMGAPRVLKSTPDEAVVSLDMTVLLMKFTFNASTSETPAPSQPATLLAMILLVTLTEYHCAGVAGKLIAAVTRAQVPANPVVVEFVVVGAGAEADTACPRRRGREQFVAGRRVRRDPVVVHVYVQVVTVRQLHIRYQAGLAGAGSCVGGRPLHVRGRKFTLADVDAS